MLEPSRPGYTLAELLVLSLHLRNDAHSKTNKSLNVKSKSATSLKRSQPLLSWHPAVRPDIARFIICASNHTQINPSGYILGVLYWTFSGCKSANKTTTKTPGSTCHRSGRRWLEEKQLKSWRKKPWMNNVRKNMGKD